MSRWRLALFSPLRPVRSGIADYTEDLLPLLAELADVDIVIDRYEPTNRSLLKDFRVLQPDEFLRRRHSYDMAVFQIGNNVRHHGYMLPVLEEVPGVTVLHDCCLQYLVLGWTLGRGNREPLQSILIAEHGAHGAARLGRQLLFSTIDASQLSFARPIVGMSRYVVVHSQHAKTRVLDAVPDKPVGIVPMGVPLPPVAREVRHRFGLRAGDFVVASISTPGRTKRLDVLLKAVSALRADIPRIRLVVTGAGSPGKDARRLMAALSRSGNLLQTGWTSSDDYHALIAAADVVADMRIPVGGETSASISRALAAAKPVVVSNQGAFRELPDSCAIKIERDDEERALRSAIRRLHDDARTRAAMGDAAREFARSTLRLDHAAQAYIECIAAARSAPVPDGSDPLWTAETRSSTRRLLIQWTYRFCRLGYAAVHYGPGDTLKRVGDEFRTAVVG